MLFIPAGTTCRAQVLDVGINKPFKTHYKSEITRWMVDNSLESGNKVGRAEVISMVFGSWTLIRSETIVNTFRTIGFNI